VYASCKISVEIDALRVVINLTTQNHELALGFLIRIPVRTYECVEQKRRISTRAIHHFTFPCFFSRIFFACRNTLVRQKATKPEVVRPLYVICYSLRFGKRCRFGQDLSQTSKYKL
jgi:hypothetical protein